MPSVLGASSEGRVDDGSISESVFVFWLSPVTFSVIPAHLFLCTRDSGPEPASWPVPLGFQVDVHHRPRRRKETGCSSGCFPAGSAQVGSFS